MIQNNMTTKSIRLNKYGSIQQNRIFILLLVLAVLIALTSCQTQPKKIPAPPAPKSDLKVYDSAQRDIKKNKKTRALKKLESLVKKGSPSDISDDAYISIGELYYEKDQYQKAFDAFIFVVNSNIYSPREAHASYMAAKSLAKLGRFDEALSLTQNLLRFDELSKNGALNVYKLRYYLLTQLGDRLDALKAMGYLINNDSDKSKINSYKVKAVDYIENQLTPEELKTVASDSSFGVLRANAYYKLGIFEFEQKEFSRAEDLMESAATIGKDTDLAEKAQNIISQIKARRMVSPKTIGVILPLSGRHKNVAYRTLKGLQLGLGIYGDNSSNIRLAVMDSQSNPDISRRAVERLVLEDHVIGIVGSLLSKTAVAVSSKAEELGVPNITLSQKAGLTDIGENVFRSALTSEMQVRELVRVAMEEKGQSKFAILYPNDLYGIEFANLFWDEVLARGGKIKGAQSYSPNSTDFSGPIQRLVGTFYVEDRISEYQELLKNWFKKQKHINARTDPPKDLLPPIIDFDAIFIPDSVKAIGQIAPALAYHDVDKITLIGTNLWNHPALIGRGQQYVENSLFVDGLLTTDKSFIGSPFYQEFFKVFDSYPTIFEAQAYDVGLLIRQVLLSGERSRVGLSRALAQIGQFHGAVGPLNVTNHREIQRQLVNLSVKDGKIVPFSAVDTVEEKKPLKLKK